MSHKARATPRPHNLQLAIGDLEAPVSSGDRKEWMIDDADISKHPVMHVAFDRNHDLGIRELSCRLHLHRLTQVEGALFVGIGWILCKIPSLLRITRSCPA